MAWNHVSPSQIESFNKCKRSWFFKSVEKIPERQSGSQATGTSFHLICEKVPSGHPFPSRSETNATEAEWAVAEALAREALPLIPLDSEAPGILREHGIRMDTYPGGPAMVGYIDLAIPQGIGWPTLFVPKTDAIVGDYKTTSDFRYMKTPEELANSVQMMSYAAWAISPSGFNADQVRLLHIYGRTRGKVSRSSIRHVDAVVSKGEIVNFWGNTLDTVREMAQTSGTGNFEDVEANGTLTGHCEAYGGCSFREKCGIGKASNIKSLFSITKKPESGEQNTMSGSSILAKIQAARALANGGTPAPSTSEATPTVSPPTETVAPVVNPPGDVRGPETTPPGATGLEVKGPLSGLLAKIAAQGKGIPALGGSAAQAISRELGYGESGLAGTGENGKTMIMNVGDLMKFAQGVVPPDAPPRTQTVITTPGTPVASEPSATASDDEDDEDAPSAPAVAGDAPKKRGRPSKEEMAAREAAEKARFDAAVREAASKLAGQPIPVAVDDSANRAEIDRLNSELGKRAAELIKLTQELAAEKAKKPIQPSNLSEGSTLYIDTYPVKGEAEVTDFFEWIGPIASAVAEANSVPDYRLINYTAKGLLAAAIREVVKAEGMPKAMTIPLYAAGADVAIEILTPLAKRVIRKL